MPLTLLLLASCVFSASQKKQQELISHLDSEIVALYDMNQRLQMQVDDCGASSEPDPIYAQLHQVFSDSEVLVQREGSITRVMIPGEQLFAAGSVRIRQEADMVLDLLATALNSHPGRRVMVEGHTDDQPISTPYYPSNWELSAARSSAIVRELSERYTVDVSNFTVAGRAHMEPLADNSTPEGRAANRRIIIHIQPGDS